MMEPRGGQPQALGSEDAFTSFATFHQFSHLCVNWPPQSPKQRPAGERQPKATQTAGERADHQSLAISEGCRLDRMSNIS
jgi:hypothetical protein